MSGFIPENMKRPVLIWITGALFLFVVLAILAWNWNFTSKNADPLTATERAWIKAHPVIRLAPDPDFPPVEFFDGNGGYNGITADYVALIEKKLGIHIEIVRLRDWDEIIDKAKSRQIDAYVATKTPQRAEYMQFTKPFLEFPVVIIARKKVNAPLSLAKLQGMKVSAVSEYAAHNLIAYNYPKLNLDLVPDVQTGLRKVSFGLSDAFVENLATASYYIEKEGITNLRIAGETEYFYRMGFCTRKDWPELNRILEKGLAGISADEKKAVYNKWIPLEPGSLFTSREFQMGILAAFAAVLMIVAGVVAWNRALARQVGRRTEDLEKELAERKRAEKALRESEEKFRVLAETTPAAICLFQGEHNVYVNSSFSRLTGYDERECLEMKFWDWMHEDFRDMAKARGLARQRGEAVPAQYELKVVTRGGEEKWVLLSGGCIQYVGKPTGIVTIFDITERKRMEEELQHARDDLENRVEERTAELAETVQALLLSRFCIEKAAIGIYQTTFEGAILIANDVACRSLGYTAAELKALKLPDIDPVITHEKMLEIKKKLDETGSATHETVHRRKDGTTFPVEITSNNLEFQGRSYTFSFVKDISERKQAEEALRESEARLKMAMDLAGLVQWEYDVKSGMFTFDDQFYALYGTTAEREGGTLMSAEDYARKFIPPEESAVVAGGIGEVLASSSNLLEHRILRADGEERFVVVRGEAVCDQMGSIVKIHGANQDITERKRAEELLRQSEMSQRKLAWELAQKNNFLRTLIDAIPDLIFYKDCNKVYLGCNRAFEAFSGRTEKDLAGCTDFDIFSRDIAIQFREMDREILSTETSRRTEEWIDYPDGRRVLLDTLKTPFFDLDGEVLGVVGISRDITERKRIEEELRNSQEKYRSIVDAYDGLIYICSQDFRAEFMNRKLIERTGYDATGGFCYEILHDRDSVCPWCVNDRVFAGETVYWEMLSPKDKRWYYVVNVPIHKSDGTVSKHSVMTDITDLKLTEETLRQQKQQLEELNATLEKRVQEEVEKNREKDIILIQQNRQAALGEMLDHIAHQWKQPLNAISFIVQDVELTYSCGELDGQYVNEMVRRTMDLLDHMVHTIEVFRDFYRPDKERTAFCVKDSIDGALAFIAPALRFQSIEVDLDVDPDLCATGFPKEYSQVLLNILTNARDAFRERKTERPLVKISAFPEGGKAIVTITDNAGGIPGEIIGKIFDMYFTTREKKGGSGIGLYMSKNIIEKNMGGKLSVLNVDGGARFRIELDIPDNEG
ncbi:MAG TPA: PAS domain S-box protein [Geobacteraceae bacterium]|nr:PAS domain S-box protein [Geobacteraceae bacterium]